MINSLLKLLNDVFDDTEKTCNCEKECKNNCETCNCCYEYYDDNDKNNKCECECECNNKHLDLTNDKDYESFKNVINSIRKDLKNDELNSIYKLFLGDNVEDTLKLFDDVAKSIHDEPKKEEKKTPELPVQQKEQIHKIVGEYVDTVIKPNTNMDTKVINDVYAGLFEFACWILNK